MSKPDLTFKWGINPKIDTYTKTEIDEKLNIIDTNISTINQNINLLNDEININKENIRSLTADVANVKLNIDAVINSLKWKEITNISIEPSNFGLTFSIPIGANEIGITGRLYNNGRTVDYSFAGVFVAINQTSFVPLFASNGTPTNRAQIQHIGQTEVFANKRIRFYDNNGQPLSGAPLIIDSFKIYWR